MSEQKVGDSGQVPTNPSELKLEFAPGCFDDWEGTEEELAEFIAEIRQMMADGSIFEKSEPVPEDEAQEILERLERRSKRQ